MHSGRNVYYLDRYFLLNNNSYSYLMVFLECPLQQPKRCRRLQRKGWRSHDPHKQTLAPPLRDLQPRSSSRILRNLGVIASGNREKFKLRLIHNQYWWRTWDFGIIFENIIFKKIHLVLPRIELATFVLRIKKHKSAHASLIQMALISGMYIKCANLSSVDVQNELFESVRQSVLQSYRSRGARGRWRHRATRNPAYFTSLRVLETFTPVK